MTYISEGPAAWRVLPQVERRSLLALSSHLGIAKFRLQVVLEPKTKKRPKADKCMAKAANHAVCL